MNELLNQMLEEMDVNKSVQHIEWLTNNTPCRISGKGDDRKAAEYICNQMQEYGLDSQILNFEAYNSHPGTSELKVVSPEEIEMTSIPCGHIVSTPEEGTVFEVVYLGSGAEEDYEGKNVRGKAVLVEVSYAPATPEKAMIAFEKGAGAMICMNWGRADQNLIGNRALKAIWGNPTPESFGKIPQLVGIGVTRKDGEILRDICLKNEKVEVLIKANSTRHWQTLSQPIGVIKGTEEPEKFLLVSGHLDAWEPGVTCNATGDGTMLELARVFGKYKDYMKRSIYFVFWNGHEIAEAAGSTWFQDYFFADINKNCIGYINIDSTGMKDASVYGADASRELSDFTHDIIKKTIDEDCNVQYLNKIGDQSFFGVGISSIAGRVSYTAEVLEKQHGATYGYWNHTTEDGLDKMDIDNLYKDNRVNLGILLGMTNSEVLPYDYTKTCQDLRSKVALLMEESQNMIDLSGIAANLERLADNVVKLNQAKQKGEDRELSKQKVKVLNDTLLRLSRCLTNAFYTNAEKYDQDSYGRTILSKPIPLLYPIVSLAKMSRDDLEYKLLYTKILRNRNRVADAVEIANNYSEMFLMME